MRLFAMLRLFFVCCGFVGLVMAQIGCRMGSPQLSLPSCMDQCFLTGGCGSGCPCPQNLKGWCEMSEDGPDSWFSRWGTCVLKDCSDDGDLTNLMMLFVAQCDGTVGGPLTNNTVPYPLRDWVPMTTATTSTAAGSSATSSIATVTEATLGSTSVTVSDSKATALDEDIASSSRATSTSSPASTTQGDPKPVMNVAAIIGVAVGGTVLLILSIGLVAFLLRRRRRGEPSPSDAPPYYNATDSQEKAHDKPELDGQAMAHEQPKIGAGESVVTPVHVPVEYAELDSGNPVRPVSELASRG
ncbi:hypothetical protein C7974DRAFT_20834 [Boeremia exigua]|uniref:uncharacterized protein n=1 Tax=Boeremia exigua TaxID=749465 RepID=UPI001E8D7D1D|nr:uncharacterized protein C7974DRAFT_20834 [Boeremia exigua]KAH6644431.1 hypothetical protein C7974DRAFT_20834 [Boeremia exigua]